MALEEQSSPQKEFNAMAYLFQGLVGKTITAHVGDETKPRSVSGKVVQGRIKVSYICDQGMNAIGSRQEKLIRLKPGENIYLVVQDDSQRIKSFYGLYPTKSPCVSGIGLI